MIPTTELSKAEQARIRLRECMSFVLGFSEQKPERIEDFIDGRSRRQEVNYLQ